MDDDISKIRHGLKHEAINVDNPDAFKESILDVVEWTQATMRDEFNRVMDATGVTEDAGVVTRLLVTTRREPGAIVAWADLPVTFMAQSTYQARLDAAARILSLKFHVEQSQRMSLDRDEITIHRLVIRYEYPRPV